MPEGIEAGKIERVDITGEIVGEDGRVNDGFFLVETGSLYAFTTDVKDTYIDANVDTTTTANLELHNTGNAYDRFVFEIVNENTLINDGITVRFEPGTTVEVGSGKSLEVEVKVLPDVDTKSGKYTLEVEVWSHGSGGSVKDSFTITVNVINDRNDLSNATFYGIISAIVIIIVIVILAFLLRARSRARRLRESEDDYDEEEEEDRPRRRAGPPKGGRKRER
jgi:hypothetical protein